MVNTKRWDSNIKILYNLTRISRCYAPEILDSRDIHQQGYSLQKKLFVTGRQTYGKYTIVIDYSFWVDIPCFTQALSQVVKRNYNWVRISMDNSDLQK